MHFCKAKSRTYGIRCQQTWRLEQHVGNKVHFFRQPFLEPFCNPPRVPFARNSCIWETAISFLQLLQKPCSTRLCCRSCAVQRGLCWFFRFRLAKKKHQTPTGQQCHWQRELTSSRSFDIIWCFCNFGPRAVAPSMPATPCWMKPFGNDPGCWPECWTEEHPTSLKISYVIILMRTQKFVLVKPLAILLVQKEDIQKMTKNQYWKQILDSTITECDWYIRKNNTI